MALTQISTAGVKDDAVTSGKIPANAVGSSELADNAVDTAAIANNAVTSDKILNSAINANKLGSSVVTTAKIADANVTTAKIATGAVTGAKIPDEAITLAKLEHGTSSNNGKFLRANNGADPSFETVSIPAGTTINTNADDRVITGSGTANTLNGESNMTYTSNTLKLQDGANDTSLLHIVGAGTSDRGLKIGTSQATGSGQNDGAAVYDAINSESNAYGSQHRFKIAGTDCFTIGYNGAKGYVGVNETVPYPDAVGGNTVNTCLELGSPSGTDTASVIRFNGRDGSGGLNRCQMQWAGANNRFDITVNGNQALQILADKDVEVTDGNLVIGTSGHGIDFSPTSDSSGSTSHEVLDDYEEGTFTPTLANIGTISYAYAIGAYTKIGRMVNVTCKLRWNSRSNDGAYNITFAGLPYACQNVTNLDYSVTVGGCEGLSANYTDRTHMGGKVLSNSSGGQFRVSHPHGGGEVSLNGSVGSTGAGYIYWSVSYYTA